MDASEISNRIAAWHDAGPNSDLATMELHQYLGMTKAEYALWTEQHAPRIEQHTLRAERNQ